MQFSYEGARVYSICLLFPPLLKKRTAPALPRWGTAAPSWWGAGARRTRSRSWRREAEGGRRWSPILKGGWDTPMWRQSMIQIVDSVVLRLAVFLGGGLLFSYPWTVFWGASGGKTFLRRSASMSFVYLFHTIISKKVFPLCNSISKKMMARNHGVSGTNAAY